MGVQAEPGPAAEEQGCKDNLYCVTLHIAVMVRRLNQDRLRKKQGAKDKLRRLVAPLLGITGASGGKLAFKAFSTIRPRISLRFEGVGVTLRDGTAILEGVNGHFRHSKVRGLVSHARTL